MRYLVQFTMPVSCSCIVEADSLIDASNMIDRKPLKHIKKNSNDFSVDDDTLYDEDECQSIIGVELYEGH